MNMKYEIFKSNATLYEHSAENVEILDSYFDNNFGLSLLKSNNFGAISGILLSPWHGRSHCLTSKLGDLWIIIKGTGCPYMPNPYTPTQCMNGSKWGMLDRKDAEKEFEIMKQVAEFKTETSIPLALKKIIHPSFAPYLIYYGLKNPYRLIDLDFMNQNDKKLVRENIFRDNCGRFNSTHLIATYKISKTLKRLYDNGLIHNSLSTHNITCALELLDFEASIQVLNSNYSSETLNNLVLREMIQLREIAYQIAWWFNEDFNSDLVEELVKETKIKF